MKRKQKNLGPKTPEQIEALLEQAAAFEPETEAPDDLVARAMANLPAARTAGRKQVLAYGACGAAAIAGMGYLTAVTIARGSAEQNIDPFPAITKPSLGVPVNMTHEPGIKFGSDQAKRPHPTAPFVEESVSQRSAGQDGDVTPEEPARPQRPNTDVLKVNIPKVQWQDRTYERTTEGVSTPAYIQREGNNGETVINPYGVIEIPTHSADKPLVDEIISGDAERPDTK